MVPFSHGQGKRTDCQKLSSPTLSHGQIASSYYSVLINNIKFNKIVRYVIIGKSCNEMPLYSYHKTILLLILYEYHQNMYELPIPTRKVFHIFLRCIIKFENAEMNIISKSWELVLALSLHLISIVIIMCLQRERSFFHQSGPVATLGRGRSETFST